MAFFVDSKARLAPGRNPVNLDDPFCPETVAHDLRKEFKHQLEIFESTRCLKIRYEDFCMDRTVFDRIRAFVESGIPGIGKIGGLS